MIENRLEKKYIVEPIRSALAEDLAGFGDITSKYLIDSTVAASSFILCKEEEGAILSGIDVAEYVLEEIDKNIEIEKLAVDGDRLENMDRICNIRGSAKSILSAERTILNFIQHMSGIATLTNKYSDIASRYGVKVVDTRKTKPLLRMFEKYAVQCGGGFNHRFGLFDGIMIKDNHIEAAGSISSAINMIRDKIPHTLKIEVEVKNFSQLDEAIEAEADIIMLDNMNYSQMIEAVAIIREKRGHSCIIEASGNVTLDTLEEKCKTGIDIISVGAITHSARAVDFSLEFE